MERDLDAQVSPTNLEDEVGGQQGLERDVEVKVGAIKLDDEVRGVDGNRIREGQVEQPMVEEDETLVRDVGEARQVVVKYQPPRQRLRRKMWARK